VFRTLNLRAANPPLAGYRFDLAFIEQAPTSAHAYPEAVCCGLNVNIRVPSPAPRSSACSALNIPILSVSFHDQPSGHDLKRHRQPTPPAPPAEKYRDAPNWSQSVRPAGIYFVLESAPQPPQVVFPASHPT
jgi:hypothetical protein